MANKILLKGYDVPRDGLAAGGTITPGDLLARTSATAAVRHATAGGAALPLFAENAADRNKGIDDNYSSGDNFPALIPRRGDQVNGRVAAAAAAIAFGDALESAGDGTVRKVSTAERAKVTLGTGNAAVQFEALQPGNEGNAITVEVIAATAATATVVVTGNAIVIKPNSTTPGTTDLASTVVTLVNGSAEAAALVVARNPGTGGSVIVSPVAATNLAGGKDAGGAPGAVVGYASEAVDNSGGGSAVRIKIEIC